MSVNELFNKANKLFLKQDYFEGLKIYEQIWIKYPKNIRLHEEINKKIKRYNKPISQTYSESDVKNFFNLEQKGQVSKVIQILTENLKKNPKDVFTISLLGSFYNSIKDYEKAISFQQTAIKKAPLERSFYLNLSETLQNKGELEVLLKHYIWLKFFLLMTSTLITK
jgi:tetratricopeptide (TPR) repeat protein